MAAVLTHSFPDRRTLTAGDRTVVRAIAEAMFAQDGEVEAERLDAHVGEVDVFVSAASRPIRFGLRIALLFVRLSPLLFFFRMRPLERLTIDERVAILARLERSSFANLSLAFIGWRTVMTLVFYEHPIELQRLGYTTDERTRYRRHLPTLAPASVPESGVRLIDEIDETLEPARSSREVA